MHVPAVRSTAIHAGSEDERGAAPRRVRRLVGSGSSAAAASTAASLFGSAGGRIQRMTVAAVESEAVAPAPIAVTAARDATTIRRKGADRERDRRKGREKQRRTQERDRKDRRDDDGGPEERKQAETEGEERAAGAQSWKDDRQQRRNARADEREAELLARQQEFDEAERLEAEEQAAAEEEERQEKEREREEEERKRQEAEEERKRLVEEERKRLVEEERKRLVEEDRKARLEAQRKAKKELERSQQEEREAEERRQAEETSVAFDAPGLTPIVFQKRANNLLALARIAQVGSIAEADSLVGKALSFAASNSRTTMTGPSYERAVAALTIVAKKLSQPTVDPLKSVRDQAVKLAEAANTKAKSLQAPPGPAKSPGALLVTDLLAAAERNEESSALSHMIKSAHDIERLRSESVGLARAIDTAAADLLLFPLLGLVPGASYSLLQSLLKTLREELSDLEITALVPLVNPAVLVQIAPDLVDAAKVAKQVPAIGVTGLAPLIPLCQFPRLANTVFLAGQLALAPAMLTANYAVVESVSAGIPRPSLTWFAGLPWPTVVALGAAFGNNLPAFVAAIPRPRLNIMLLHNVPAVRMHACHAADPLRLLRWGATDKVWKHLTTTKISKSSGQISGGHDSAQFMAFYNNLLSSNWTAGAALHSVAHPTMAGVTRVTYHLVDPKFHHHHGAKTLINGLAGARAVWAPLIEAAAWDAITFNRFNANTWTGVDGNGDTWTGFFAKSAIDTAYPV